MPRSKRTSVTRLPDFESQSKTPRTQVTAQRVGMGPMPQATGELDSLLQSLSKFNTGLLKHIEQKATEEVEAGMAAKKAGNTGTGDESDSWKRGYIIMEGRARGMEDAEAGLAADYETKFDKDGGNIEAFISTQFAERTKGLQDEEYLKGYTQTFGVAAQKLREHHAQAQLGHIADRHDAHILGEIDKTVRSYTDQGLPISLMSFEPLKQQLKSNMKVDYATFNERLFEAVRTVGDEGNPGVYAMFTRENEDGTYGEKNADGTPGMFNSPKWRDKIASAEAKATAVLISRDNQAYEMAARQRSESQDSALYSAFEKLYAGDTVGAGRDFATHVESGLFSRASDIVKWTEMFRKVDNRELRGDEQVAMTETLTGIYTGRVALRDILNAGLPPAQTRQLLTEWRTVQQQERQAAAETRATVDQPFKSHAFKEQEDWLESALKPTHGILDKATEKDQFMYAAQATAKLELAEHVRANGLKDLRATTVAIMERHKKRVAAFEADRLDSAAANLRYSTLEAAMEAYERHEMSAADAQLHLEYFEARSKQRTLKK